MKVFLKFCIVFISFVSLTSFQPYVAEETHGTYLNYGIPINQLISGPIVKENFSVFIQKSSYTVFLKYNGRLIKSYPCVFGPDPINDKFMQGDNCTPEGIFHIDEIYEHFIWGYFLKFDYPNNDSWSKHLEAKEFGKIPQSANIGGDLGLHGVVDGFEAYIDTKNNWTEGCVSLKNSDIIEIAQHLTVGTQVKIAY